MPPTSAFRGIVKCAEPVCIPIGNANNNGEIVVNKSSDVFIQPHGDRPEDDHFAQGLHHTDTRHAHKGDGGEQTCGAGNVQDESRSLPNGHADDARNGEGQDLP